MNRADIAAFAASAASQGACLFGADEGPNIQIGTRRLCVAFDRTSQQRTIEENGFRYLCDAVAHIPLATGLTEADLPIGRQITYLPAAETYRIDARRAQPLAGYIRLVLRRVNGQALAAPSL